MRSRAAIVLLLVALAPPAHALSLRRMICASLNRLVFGPPPVVAKAPAWRDWPTLQAKLRRAQADILEEAKTRQAPTNQPQVGGTVRCLGGDYRILGVLGSGGEGVSYLVKGPGDKLCVIKKFNPTTDGFEIADYFLRKSRKPVPKLIYRDSEERTVMMEYIPGIPMNRLTLAEKYGLTPTELEEANRHFANAGMPKNEDGISPADSTLLNVENGAFYLIDPH